MYFSNIYFSNIYLTFLPIHQLPSYFSNICRKSPILKLKEKRLIRINTGILYDTMIH